MQILSRETIFPVYLHVCCFLNRALDVRLTKHETIIAVSVLQVGSIDLSASEWGPVVDSVNSVTIIRVP